MVWVGGKKQISLSRFSPVALTALSTSFVTIAYSALAQYVDTLNDSTDSLTRIFFAQSNGGIQLLKFRITNYSDHVLYHFCTIFRCPFRYHIPVTAISLLAVYPPENLSGVRVCYPTPAACSCSSSSSMHAGSCMPVHACWFIQYARSSSSSTRAPRSMHACLNVAAAAAPEHRAACMHALTLETFRKPLET